MGSNGSNRCTVDLWRPQTAADWSRTFALTGLSGRVDIHQSLGKWRKVGRLSVLNLSLHCASCQVAAWPTRATKSNCQRISGGAPQLECQKIQTSSDLKGIEGSAREAAFTTPPASINLRDIIWSSGALTDSAHSSLPSTT
jgi:hypothetical protein